MEVLIAASRWWSKVWADMGVVARVVTLSCILLLVMLVLGFIGATGNVEAESPHSDQPEPSETWDPLEGYPEWQDSRRAGDLEDKALAGLGWSSWEEGCYYEEWSCYVMNGDVVEPGVFNLRMRDTHLNGMDVIAAAAAGEVMEVLGPQEPDLWLVRAVDAVGNYVGSSRLVNGVERESCVIYPDRC